MKKYIVICFSILVFGCASNRYSINRFIQYEQDGFLKNYGFVKSSSIFQDFFLEPVSILKNVSIDSSLFSKDTIQGGFYKGSVILDLEEYIKKGIETYFLFYNNHITFCCDSRTVGSLIFLFKVDAGSVDLDKSLIARTGSLQLPHEFFIIEKLEFTDSSFYVETKENVNDERHMIWFEASYNLKDSGDLSQYTKSKKDLESKL